MISWVRSSTLASAATAPFAGVLYILSLGLLTFSSSMSPSPSRAVVFYGALYLLAVAQGFHTPCTEAFGADQFAAGARASRSSYFNWYHFSISWGYAISPSVISYVDDNVGWTVGFAACWAAMVAYLAVFLLGTPTYRRVEQQPRLAAAARAWASRVFSRKKIGATACITERLVVETEEEVDGHGEGMRFSIVKLVPIWVTSIVFAAVISQVNTLFTKQGSTMDRRLGGIVVPAAALQCFVSFTYIALLPVYDRAVVPLASRLTGDGEGKGITMLQRIGAGMATSCLAMAVAALVEARRLRAAARDATTIAVWWLVPQHVLVGVAEVLGLIGMEEFFYDQVPGELRSVGLAVSQGFMGVGSYASGALVAAIDWATTRGGGGESWFADDLNRAHLDYFYWILAGLAALEVILFVYIAQRYDYRNKAKT